MTPTSHSFATRIPLLALLPLTIVGCADLPVGQRVDVGNDEDEDDASSGERDLGFDPEEIGDASSTPMDTSTPPALDVAPDGEEPTGDGTSVHDDVADVAPDVEPADGSAASDVTEVDTAVGEDTVTDAPAEFDTTIDTMIDAGSDVEDSGIDTSVDADADTDVAPYRPEAIPGTLFADFLDALTPGTLQTYCEELFECDGPYGSVEECVGTQYSYAEYVLERTEYFYGYFASDCGLALGVFYDCYYAYKFCGDDGTMDYATAGDDCVDEYFFRYYACNPFS
jgi:hypothetical protein